MSNEETYQEVQEDYTYDEFIDSLIPSDEILEEDELFAQFCDRMGDEEFAAYEASYDDLPF